MIIFYVRYWLSCTNTGRLVLHIIPGIGMGFGLLWKPWVGVCWTVLCIFYQWIEDWRIYDNSYLDIRGYKVGFWVGVLIYLVVKGL